MATTTFSLASFVNLPVPADLLVQLEATVWPSSLFPAVIVYRGGAPDAEGLIQQTVGNFDIITPVAPSALNISDAITFFGVYVPVIGARNSVTVAQLTFQGFFQGQTVFASDEPRQGGSMGVLVYWDGRDRTWRRIRDDSTVATIP